MMRKQPCVHVIDDDPGVRESLKALVGNAGYEVHCYASAENFLSSGADRRGCALVDLRMQGMDGISLQKKLIEQNSPVDVIMISAYGDVEHAVAAMRLGAVDFIEKPFDPDHLLQRIANLVRVSDNAELAHREALQHAALIDTLTAREKQVLGMIVDGLANKQVANELGISARTVETHRVHIMQKLNAESLPHLVRIWISAGQYLEMPAS